MDARLSDLTTSLHRRKVHKQGGTERAPTRCPRGLAIVAIWALLRPLSPHYTITL